LHGFIEVMTRLELGTLSVDLDALDALAGWLDSAATAHDGAGSEVGGAFAVDWAGSAALSGDLARARWEQTRRTTAAELRTLAAATRAASRGYAAAGAASVRLWAQVAP
jgi:uncharacterized protein YukE